MYSSQVGRQPWSSFTVSLCPLGLFQDPLVVFEEQLNIFELDSA